MLVRNKGLNLQHWHEKCAYLETLRKFMLYRIYVNKYETTFSFAAFDVGVFGRLPFGTAVLFVCCSVVTCVTACIYWFCCCYFTVALQPSICTVTSAVTGI